MVFCVGKKQYDQIREAKTFWQRFMGLMGCKKLEEGEGLWFPRCSSIHCFFMKIPIDVIYFDKNYFVVGMECVYPWHIGHLYKGAAHILELGQGASKGICVGDRLTIRKE